MVSMRETIRKRSPPGKSAKWVPPRKVLKYQFMYLVVTCTKSVQIKQVYLKLTRCIICIFKTNMMYYYDVLF